MAVPAPLAPDGTPLLSTGRWLVAAHGTCRRASLILAIWNGQVAGERRRRHLARSKKQWEEVASVHLHGRRFFLDHSVEISALPELVRFRLGHPSSSLNAAIPYRLERGGAAIPGPISPSRPFAPMRWLQAGRWLAHGADSKRRQDYATLSICCRPSPYHGRRGGAGAGGCHGAREAASGGRCAP